MHDVNLVHKVAIVNERGEVKGYLKVKNTFYTFKVLYQLNVLQVAIEGGAGTQNGKEQSQKTSGVRQTAKLNFRKEDFKKDANGWLNNYDFSTVILLR